VEAASAEVDERLASPGGGARASPAGSTLRIALARGSAGTVAAALPAAARFAAPGGAQFRGPVLGGVRQEASA